MQDLELIGGIWILRLPKSLQFAPNLAFELIFEAREASLFHSFSKLRFFLKMSLVPLESCACPLSNKIGIKKSNVLRIFLQSDNYLENKYAGHILRMRDMSRKQNHGYSGRNVPDRFPSRSMIIPHGLEHKSTTIELFLQSVSTQFWHAGHSEMMRDSCPVSIL